MCPPSASGCDLRDVFVSRAQVVPSSSKDNLKSAEWRSACNTSAAVGTNSPAQKYSFRANWIIRGATLVFEITPNAGSGWKPAAALAGFDMQSPPARPTEPASKICGSANDGVLKALKNSALNSRDRVSLCPKGIFLIIEMSKSCCAGPLTFPMPPLPNAVATPSAPIIGGAVKQEELK